MGNRVEESLCRVSFPVPRNNIFSVRDSAAIKDSREEKGEDVVCALSAAGSD